MHRSHQSNQTPSPHSLLKNGKQAEYSLPFTSITQWLADLAHQYGDKPALIFDDYSAKPPLTMSYQQLRQLVDQTGRLLNQYCHHTGEKVSFCFPNSPEIVLFNLAAWSQGWVTVPLDSKRDTTEIKIYKLQQTGAKVLFTRANKQTQKENQQIKKVISDIEIVTLDTVDSFLALLDSIKCQSNQLESKTKADNRSSADPVALVLYTSGTTALPKGAQLTLGSLMANAASIADWLQFDQADRWQVVLPLHHINSSTFVNTTLLAGGTVVLVPQYSKSQFWATMAKHGCTGTSIVPTIAYDLLSEQSAYDQNRARLKQVKRIQLGSAPVQPTVVKQFVQRYNIRLQQGYGQTETSLRSTGVPMGLTKDKYLKLVELNTLGTELKYTNVTVLDAAGYELPAETEGEICVRGPIIMQDYLNKPEATAEAFEHNWFHSGDTGYWQDLSKILGPKFLGQKFFFLKGRTKEIIKKGGVLISPLAIENALLKTYNDIQSVYVVGFPDQRLGEEIGFVVVSNNSHIVEQILSDCRSGKFTALEPYEYPVAGLKIDQSELPLTSTGKVQRIKIKELFGAKLAETSTIFAQTEQHVFRTIKPDETNVLKQAVKINNQRWGQHLAASLDEFVSRAEHGVLIGMFERARQTSTLSGALIGTISAIKVDSQELKHAGEPSHWTSTWNEVTDVGRLTTSNHKGNTLLLVSVSTKSTQTTSMPARYPTSLKSQLQQPQFQAKIAQLIAEYQDPVLQFHLTPKAGLQSGAKIRAILPQARPKDIDSLGYCVLMAYPNFSELKQRPTINPESSYGTQLVEAAIVWAEVNQLDQVFAYTRPSSLRKTVK